ncbi:hypothetical protein DITRI_Ditri07aG0063500 [Diplodiscus trichospermus]
MLVNEHMKYVVIIDTSNEIGGDGNVPHEGIGHARKMKNLNTKLYANSLVGVGVASTLHHSSRGKLRRYLRRAYYTMISTATVVCSN